MGLRSHLRHLGATLFVLVVSACRPAAAPDLVLVTVDTLRADVLSCYGGPPDVGTALCRPAETGTRFAWAFAAAPYTVPSVASLLTSRYPSGHRVSQFSSAPMEDDAETVAEKLAEAGYDTAAFVSNPVLASTRNLGQGFGLYDDEMTQAERNRPGYAERNAAQTTDAVLAWLAKAGRPFFLWVHYQDPHGPYEAPEGRPLAPSKGGTALPVLRDNSGFHGIPAYQALPRVRRAADYRERYLAEIRYLDREFGRLLAALDERAPAAGVLVTADHGEALGEDGYFFAHGHSLGLDQIHVPLLWRSPGGGNARVVERPVSLLDVAPTLLVAAGVDPPSRFQGVPLPGSGSDEVDGRTFYAEHHARGAVIAGQRYYARDLRDLSQPVLDPNSSGRLRPLQSRRARLVGDPLPAYRPGAAPELERLLGAFLQDRSEAPPDVLDDATRQRLRALGYLD